MLRRFLVLSVLICLTPAASSARLALKPAPQLWVYAARMDVESAKKLVEQNPLDPAALGRALYNALRRYKASEASEQLQIAKLLLSHGANPNYTALNGQTPLMAAAAAQAEPLVRLLLENGAKPDAADSQGKTAADFARRGLGTPNAVLSLLRTPPPPNPLYTGPTRQKPEVQNLGMDDQGKAIVFTFDLTASEPVCVKLVGSFDGGATNNMVFKALSGDVGKNVSPGPGKSIVWEVAADYPKGFATENVVVDVEAAYCK